MPTVQPYQRRVEVKPLPGPQLTAAPTAVSEGAGLEQARIGRGEALARLGGTVAEAGLQGYRQTLDLRAQEILKARQEANQIWALDASNRLSSKKRDMLYGVNGQGGILAIEGKNAMGVPEKAALEFRTYADAIGAEASTPEQQLAYARIRSDQEQDFTLDVTRHVDAEIKRYGQEQFVARVGHLQNEAAAGAKTPETVEVKRAESERTIRAWGEGHGWSGEQQDAAVAKSNDTIIEQSIDNLIAWEAYPQAQALYDQNADYILEDRRPEVLAKLANASVAQQAQEAFDKMRPTDLTEQQMRHKAYEQTQDNPKLRQQLLDLISEEWAKRNQFTQQAREALGQQLYEKLVANGYRISSISSDPRFTHGLRPAEQEQMKDWAKAHLAGTPVGNNLLYYDQMMQERKSTRLNSSHLG